MATPTTDRIRNDLNDLQYDIRALESQIYGDTEAFRRKRIDELQRMGMDTTTVVNEVEAFRRQRQNEVNHLRQQYEQMSDEIRQLVAQDAELEDEFNRPRGIFG